jgi:hypothetical protein
MKPPTLEEVIARADEILLPAREAQKFYCFYESKGWRVGKSPMKVWRSALAHWKLVWEERSGKPVNGAETVMRHEEFKRVEQKMKSIKDSYAEHQSWSDSDRWRWGQLKARKLELMKMLGMQV